MKYLFFVYCAVLLTIIWSTKQALSSSVSYPIITTIAGLGVCDGEQAQFAVVNNPRGVAIFNDEIYIADTGTGIAGYNGDNILATNARLNNPSGIAVDSNGEILISEFSGHRIRKILNNGTIITIAGTGTAGYNGDNILATTAQLYSPFGITTDSSGQVFFTEVTGQTVRKILNNGMITTIAGTRTGGYNGDNILATSALLFNPYSVSVASNGEVYIADRGNHRIRKILTNGMITTIAGTGTLGYNGDNIVATTAQLNIPNSVRVDPLSGEVYITDSNNQRIRKILNNGLITTIAGTATKGYNGDNILATTAQLNVPFDSLKTKDGEILISDSSNHRIRKILANGNIVTIAGTGVTNYCGEDLLASKVPLFNPKGLFVAPNNDIYIADTGNNRIRKIKSDGTIITIAGTGVAGYDGDNILAVNTKLSAPYGVTVSAISNEVYIADTGNNRIRKIKSDGTIITIAGTGTAGYNGDSILATTAQLRNPYGVTVDSNGEILIADTINCRIRKILNNGTIITIAGTGVAGYDSDNILATTAQLRNPYGVTVDSNGEILIVDSSNSRIRKILTNGTITTVAGSGPSGVGTYSGDNFLATAARLSFPSGVDSVKGEIYISDTYSNRIRKVLNNGTIITIAGTGAQGHNGDNILATSAQLTSPYGVAIKPNGEILITTGNYLRSISTITVTSLCNGTLASDPSVCNGVGACLSTDKCSCNDGYTGSLCEYFVCNNTSSDSPNVCSGHGQCIAPNLCNCTTLNYGGQFCNEPFCFGISSNNTSVCSGHGICSGPNQCNCNTGWQGSNNCSTATCELMNSCSGNGVCGGPNNCTCNAGWKGANCSEYSCNLLNDCSGNGICVGPNQCLCSSGFNGSLNCDTFSCEMINNCSGHGTCTGSNNCTCNDGWKGSSNCSAPTCEKVDNCSGHGTCIGPNQCLCNEGWGEHNCSIYNCLSVNTCSNHGICIGPNICNCSAGWEGSNCSTVNCDNRNNCSSHGICSGPNQCTCDSGWKGNNNCSAPSCDALNNCNGHGICSGPNTCNCQSGWKGNLNCSLPSCESMNDCSGHGSCIGPNQCNCNSDWNINSNCSQPSPIPNPIPSVQPQPSASLKPHYSPKPSPMPSPKSSHSPVPNYSPKPSPSVHSQPQPTISVKPMPSPKPSIQPQPSASLKPHYSPMPSPKPSPSIYPQPTASFKPHHSPKPSPTPNYSPKPSSSTKPQSSPKPSPKPSVQPQPQPTISSTKPKPSKSVIQPQVSVKTSPKPLVSTSKPITANSTHIKPPRGFSKSVKVSESNSLIVFSWMLIISLFVNLLILI